MSRRRRELDAPQPRRAARAMAGEAFARRPERVETPEDPIAALAPVGDPRARFPEAPQGRRLGGVAVAGPEAAGEAPEEGAMGRPGALDLPGPGMRGLVAQRVLLLGGREMGRDRDAVRRAVDDQSACELAPGDPHARRMEAEPGGQP